MRINLKEKHASKLRRALLGNALFSGFSGILIVLAEPLVLGWLGLQEISIWPIGAGLLIFSAYLFWMSQSTKLPGALVMGVILGDWAWIAGTVVLLLLKAQLFSGFGVFLLLDIALVVAIFAILQARGLKTVSAS
jgi:predicted ABC-type exoprotein transport system permease subunit